MSTIFAFLMEYIGKQQKKITGKSAFGCISDCDFYLYPPIVQNKCPIQSKPSSPTTPAKTAPALPNSFSKNENAPFAHKMLWIPVSFFEVIIVMKLKWRKK